MKNQILAENVSESLQPVLDSRNTYPRDGKWRPLLMTVSVQPVSSVMEVATVFRYLWNLLTVLVEQSVSAVRSAPPVVYLDLRQQLDNI